MTLLCLADIHGRVDLLAPLAQPAREADVVIVAGDLTQNGGTEDAALAIEPVLGWGKPVLAVPGNMDRPSVLAYLQSRAVNLHGRGVELQGMGIAGVGGAAGGLAWPFCLTEAEIAVVIAAGREELGDAPLAILVAHQPPLNTLIDLTCGGGHAGSAAVRSLIERHEPALCVCGHVHEAHGVDFVARTTCVNVGALKDGRYCMIEMGDDDVTVSRREL